MCDWGPWGGGVLRPHRCIMVSLPFIDYMACAHHVKCPPHFSGLISGISIIAHVAYMLTPLPKEGVREGVREMGRGRGSEGGGLEVREVWRELSE